LDGGKSAQVDYAGLARDRATFGSYLASLSAVTEEEYAGWTKPQQLAFLINAYNAFTVAKVLTRYPDLESIRDFGWIFGNPWRDRFFVLLGERENLDGIEHERIRRPGAFDEPRIHFALNCASIGCPSLREEAYVAERLDAQLEEQVVRFLSDASRNRFDPESGFLEVSPIFDWYGEDFRRGWRGVTSVEQFLAGYADQLAESDQAQARVRAGNAPLRYLDYDWSLNDEPRSSAGSGSESPAATVLGV